ncbi:hypothetical protein GOP47_0002253 [Adiantum capillus-veneris]|uniref:Scarecrow-like protein 33 n=1 Tax=Adiantum capillus-veneris TaxID=13818 RepID=A0A9D4ZRG7_ADICA|nr:hypothetical protein GOP47_0002253 [Adiantum capillus-veneris]
MDSSLTVQLQQRAWLHTQLVKRLSSSALSPSSSISSSSSAPHAQAPSWPPYLFPSTDPWSPALSSDAPSKWDSEIEAWDNGALLTTSSSSSSLSPSSSDSSSWGASSSPYRGPSSASSDPWMPGNQLVHSSTASLDTTVAVETASFANDVLMDPMLEFISDMLMDENMEDRKCMQQECLSYQAMVNGVTGNESSLRSSIHCAGMLQRLRHAETLFVEGNGTPADHSLEQEEDYRWIENVLVTDPIAEGNSAKEEEACMLDSGLNKVGQEKIWGTWPLPRSESSSFSNSRDSQVCSFESSLSSSPFFEHGAYRMLDKNLRASMAIDLPSAHRAYTAPSPPNIPSVQEILSKDMVPVSDALLSGNGQVPQRQLAPLSLESLQANGFSGGVESNQMLSFFNVEGVHQKKGLLVETNQAQSADASVEQPLSFVKNEYLNAEKHAKMYGDWWPDQGALVSKKKRSQQGNGKKSGKAEPVDLRSLLVECAQAVGANNLKKANEIVQELRKHATPHGSAAQRLAHYFTEGLVARLAGTGAQQFTAMSNNRPSAANMIKAFRLIVEVCPFAKLAHFFANQNILKVAEGASRLHIVDYGILYGVQWPALISALAERRGGPPFLRITGIEFPQPGLNPSERVEETGRRLAEYAKTYNVPFEYQAIARKWEDIEPADLNLREGEVLAVNCVQRLRHLMDETVISASPRRKVLSRMHSLNPDIVLIAVLNAGYNAPFFVSRFREALYHYSSKFDMIETTVADIENPQRLMLERECLGRDILNIVACEGHERVERPETYRQWQARFQRAGFEPFTLNRSVLKKARNVVKAFYHKDFSVDDDSKWMLLGWKGRIMEGLSAWKRSSPGLGV